MAAVGVVTITSQLTTTIISTATRISTVAIATTSTVATAITLTVAIADQVVTIGNTTRNTVGGLPTQTVPLPTSTVAQLVGPRRPTAKQALVRIKQTLGIVGNPVVAQAKVK